MAMNGKILIIDDDPRLRKTLSDILAAKGYEPTVTATGKEALDSVGKKKPDVALIDLRLEDMSGLDVIKSIRECSPDTECILITGHASQASAIEAVNLGAYSYIQKPYNVDQLLLTVRRAIETKMSEKALQESRRRMATLMSNLPGMAYRCKNTPDWTMEFVSDGCEPLTGYKPEDLIENGRLSFAEIIHPEDRLSVWHGTQETLKDRQPFQLVYRIVTANSEEKWVWEQGRGIFGTEGNLIALEGFIADITDRKIAEQRERDAMALLRLAMESADEGVWEWNHETDLITFDEIALRMLGYEPDMPKKTSEWWFSRLHPDDRPFIEQAYSAYISGESSKYSVEFRLRRKDGGYTWISSNARIVTSDHEDRPLLVAGIHRDITERKQNEEEREKLRNQLVQSQKMESIATLAGGIAHDFNNILSSIIGFTELTLDDVEKGSVIEENLQEVYAAGKRARDLIRQFLTFARQSEEELKPIQIDATVKEVLKFIRSSIPTTIEIKPNITSDSLIMGNPTQVHQILMNCCANAAYAMEDEGGVLEVSLKDVIIGSTPTMSPVELKPGDYIELKISDTGVGIPPDILDSIFEPYFTTKAAGEGTGLGLAVVHGIVESYGGKIMVDSRQGQGTLFTIYLPIIKKRYEHTVYSAQALPTGKERILFVDDEDQIANISSQILERLGYSVSTCTNSMEALELFRGKPDDFDLVITDMTMPKMTGDRLAVELMKIRSDIPVILCTGYSKKISDETALEIGIKALAYKPIAKADLAKTIRNVLDDAGSSKQG